MRALPLWPPYSELVINGAKVKETRPRPIKTLVGERIAIYTTKTEPPEGRAYWEGRWPFREYELSGAPVGVVIGTVRVVDMERMTPVFCQWMRDHHPREHAMGDYRPGRYAFTLEDPRRLATPIPWRGTQGVFMVPDDLVERAELAAAA